jgi:hypothetical protein
MRADMSADDCMNAPDWVRRHALSGLMSNNHNQISTLGFKSMMHGRQSSESAALYVCHFSASGVRARRRRIQKRPAARHKRLRGLGNRQ